MRIISHRQHFYPRAYTSILKDDIQNVRRCIGELYCLLVITCNPRVRFCETEKQAINKNKDIIKTKNIYLFI